MMPPLTAPVVGLMKPFWDTPGRFVNPLGDCVAPRLPAGRCSMSLDQSGWSGCSDHGRPRSGGRSSPLALNLGLRSDPDHVEIFISDWIDIFLAEELALNEDVDARRKGIGVLGAVQRDRARVLLAPEDQLRFLLALGFVPPRGEGDAHENGHDGQADEQRRHCVTALVLDPVNS